MVYEALLGLHSLSPFFSMTPVIATSATSATSAPTAPINTLLGSSGETEGAFLYVDAPPKRRRTAFDFSTYQHQHKEAAWTLATFSSAGAGAALQGDAGGHHGTGEAVVAMTTTSRSIYPVADVPAGHVLGGIQHQQERQQLQLQQLRLGAARPRALRPRLVVGPGQFGGRVGLLEAMQPPELIKYLTLAEGGLPKPPRASRTDLSHLTKKEKVDRHREQTRLNCQRKRKQALLLEAGLEQEVTQMRTYKEAIDMAPFVMVVVSATINDCRILYVNKPVTEKLGYEVAKLFGRSFVMMANPQDRAHLASVLHECIRTAQPHHGRVLCRFWCMKGAENNQQQPFKQMDMTVNIGTKGLICNLWEVCERR